MSINQEAQISGARATEVDLSGKVALVTGAARGQGRSHAVALARAGAEVVAIDLCEDIAACPYPLSRPDDLAETVRQVEALDRRCVSIVADCRSSRAVDAAVERTVEEFGKLDILVANHGIYSAGQIVDMTDDQWVEVLDTMANGTFYAVRAAARVMIPNNSGRIICTGSTASRQGMMNVSSYAAAKWAVLGFVKSAALELGPHYITVNAVCPTATKSPMMYENDFTYRMFCPDKENPTTADVEEVILRDFAKMPVPFVDPEDISAAVLFLASEGARYISGIGIDVNAGLSGFWSS